MKKIMLLFVFVLAGMSTVLSQSIPFKDSGSKEGAIELVEVTGNNSVPVKLIKGTHAIFTVKFKALETIYGDKVVIKGYMHMGTPTPMPLKDVNLDPLPIILKGSVQTVYIRVDVLPAFPTIRFDLELYLENQNTGNRIISFKVPAEIVK